MDIAATDKGSSSDSVARGVTSKDVTKAFTAPRGNGALAQQDELPQVATSFQIADNGPSILSSTSQTQASADDGGRPYFLDKFCGTAGVAAAFKRYGTEAIGIDHVLDRKRMKGPAVKMDLTLESSQQMVLDEIRSGRVDGVTLAPPCGTSSKARNIPMKDSKGRKKKGPPPLRSERHFRKDFRGYKGPIGPVSGRPTSSIDFVGRSWIFANSWVFFAWSRTRSPAFFGRQNG